VIVGIMLVSSISLATGPFTNKILIDVLVMATAGVALTVLIGHAGQISLGHFALVGVGAFAAGNLYDHGPVPFPLVIPLVFLIGMVVTLVIGLPALRIRGPYLAVVTVAFALAASQWIFYTDFVARGTTGMTITPPDYGWLNLRADSNRPLFFFALAVFLFCAFLAQNFKESRTGRGFFSLRENEKAAATFGVQLTRYRLLAFMLSGGMASLAGLTFGMSSGGFSAIDFPVELSFVLVAMVIIGGLGSITGALLGSFLVFGVRELLLEGLGQSAWVPYAVTFGTGLALILVITRARGGLAGLVLRLRDPVVEGLVWEAEQVPSSLPPRGGNGAAATTAQLETTRFDEVNGERDGEDLKATRTLEADDIEVVSTGNGARRSRRGRASGSSRT
jgi:branched-chain amino acid transport system permease protein